MENCLTSSYPLVIHAAGLTNDIRTTHQETINRSEYKVVEDEKIDFILFDQGDLSTWQANTLMYNIVPGRKVAWFIYTTGAGKTGCMESITEHYKRWNESMSESTVFDFIHGASDYINGAIVLAPNKYLLKQMKFELVMYYSRKGDYPRSNESIIRSYGGTSNKGGERKMTQELAGFYIFKTHETFVSTYITAEFLPIAYSVQTERYGYSDSLRLTREIVYETMNHPDFIQHCQNLMDNKVICVDEITSMIPIGHNYKAIVNEIKYAGSDEIYYLSSSNRLDDNKFLDFMGTYTLKRSKKGGSFWKPSKSEGKETSSFRTYFMFCIALRHTINSKLILASATPVQNPAKLESIAGQLNMFASILKVPFIGPDTQEILDFINYNMRGKIGYIERIPASLSKIYETAITPIDEEYLASGVVDYIDDLGAVIIPMGYFQSWKYFALCHLSSSQLSDDKKEMVAYGVMPTSSTRNYTIINGNKVKIFNWTRYISGSKTARSLTGERIAHEPQRFSVSWESNKISLDTQMYFSNLETLVLYSPKFTYIIRREEEHRLQAMRDFPNTANKFGLGITVVYSYYIDVGLSLKAFGLTLELHQGLDENGNPDPDLKYEMFNPYLSASVMEDNVYLEDGVYRVNKEKLRPKLRYFLFTSTTPDLIRDQAMQILSSPDNINGAYIKMILMSDIGQKGITIGNGLRMYHLKSPSLLSEDTQLNGRISRAKVHEYIINAVKENGDDPSLLKVTITRLVSQIYMEVLNGDVVITPYSGGNNLQMNMIRNDFNYYNQPGFDEMWKLFWSGLNINERQALIDYGGFREHQHEVQIRAGNKYITRSEIVMKPSYYLEPEIDPRYQNDPVYRETLDYRKKMIIGYDDKYMTDEIRSRLYGENNMRDYDNLITTIKNNTFDYELNFALNNNKGTRMTRTEKDERYHSIINRERIAELIASEIVMLTSTYSYIKYTDFVDHVQRKYGYCEQTIDLAFVYIINNRLAQEVNNKVNYITLYEGYIYMTGKIMTNPANLLSLTSSSLLIEQGKTSLIDYLGMNDTFMNSFLDDDLEYPESTYTRLTPKQKQRIIESLNQEELYNPDMRRNSMIKFFHFSRFWIHFDLPRIDVLRRSRGLPWTESLPFSSKEPIRAEVANRSSRTDYIIAHTFISEGRAPRVSGSGYSSLIMNVHGLMRLYIDGSWRDATPEETTIYKNYILERRREKVYYFEVNKLIHLVRTTLIDKNTEKSIAYDRIRNPILEDLESSKIDKRTVHPGKVSTDDSMVIKYLWELNAPPMDNKRSPERMEADYKGRMKSIKIRLEMYDLPYDESETQKQLNFLSWLFSNDYSSRKSTSRLKHLKEHLERIGFFVNWDIDGMFM